MKKCPRCGAVLDDSKVKCYMCGTDLPRQNLTFGNSFNETIGAAVANGQGNVFNQNNQIQSNIQGTGGNQSNQTVFSPNAGNSSFYNNQLNNLNSMAYDERTPLEKMFSSDAGFKSKQELNAQKQKRKNSKRNAFANSFTNSMAAQNQQANNPNYNRQQPMPQQPVQQPAKPKKEKKKLFDKKNKAPKQQTVNNQAVKQVRPMMPNQPAQQTVQQVRPQQQQNKPSINWGNNLSNNRSNYQKKEPINKAFIFNIFALIISIAGALFVYFKFIKNKDGMKVRQIGQLTYTINNNFIVKDERSNYRLHTFGEYCSISITYGNTNTPNDYIDNFIEKLKKDGDYGNKYKVLVSKFQDNTNNTWVETSLVYVSADAAAELGYNQKTKIHYASIIFDGNYYTIVYQNDNDDTICSASYQSFVQSLAFK